MNIDEIVRASMDRVASDIQPPVPDPAAVRARVNRSSRIRAISAIGLAAAVAAGVIVSVTELRDRSNGSGPAHSVERFDSGINVNAVWMGDGILHIGDREYPQDKQIDTALVPLGRGAVYGATDGEIVYQPEDGPAQVIETDGAPQLASAPTPGPAADPDSALIAVLRWSTADGRYDLYFYDAARGHQLGTGLPIGDGWDLPGDPNPFGDTPVTPVEWAGPNQDGSYTALIRVNRELWRYDAKGDGSGSLRQVGPMPSDVTLDVIAVADVDGHLSFTTLAGDALSSVDGVGSDGGLSHDGVYYAGSSNDPGHSGAIAIVDTHTGEKRYIDPPDPSAQLTHLSWAAGHTLMFLAPETDDPSSPGSVIACDADSLRCVDVGDVTDVSTAVLPRL